MASLTNNADVRITVPDEVVPDYLKQGWRHVGQTEGVPEPAEKPKPKTRRPRK